MAAAGALPGVVQTVLTGTLKPNAALKLRAFGLDQFFDLEIGGYGSDAYPRGSLLLRVKNQAGAKFGAELSDESVVYIADTVRDVEAAATGGARSLAVATGRSTAAELREAGADAVLADLSDLEQVITAIDRLTKIPVGR